MIAALLIVNWLTFWRDTNTYAATAANSSDTSNASADALSSVRRSAAMVCCTAASGYASRTAPPRTGAAT